MRSFLQQIENKFMILNESIDATTHKDDNVDDDADLEEQNVTGALDGGAGPPRTPGAFRKTVKRVNYASGVEESVNKPADWTMGSYQKPEDGEEEYTDKFPFAEHDNSWQHKNYKYPSVDMRDTPGLSKRKDKTQHVKRLSVAETMDAKYENLIESYRTFATGDAKLTPEQKIKHTIKEVAKQLQEIERTVNYASRLKTESGVARNGYGSAVDSALTKISERLIKISERVRALGE